MEVIEKEKKRYEISKCDSKLIDDTTLFLVKDFKYNIYFWTLNPRNPNPYFLGGKEKHYKIDKRDDFIAIVYRIMTPKNELHLRFRKYPTIKGLGSETDSYRYFETDFSCEYHKIKASKLKVEIEWKKEENRKGRKVEFIELYPADFLVLSEKEYDKFLALPDETDLILVNENKNQYFLEDLCLQPIGQSVTEGRILFPEEQIKHMEKMMNRYSKMIVDYNERFKI